MHCRLSYRLFALVAIVLSAFSCGRDNIIPKDKMIEILSEMFLTDQYARENIQRQRMADTSYVYRPIIESFGYTEDDFRRSVNKYIEKPAEFGAMFGAVAKDLRARKKDVDILEGREHKIDSLNKAITALPIMNPDSNKVLSFIFRFLKDSTKVEGLELPGRTIPMAEKVVEEIQEEVVDDIEEVVEEAFD